jgi:hypothetical protein
MEDKMKTGQRVFVSNISEQNAQEEGFNQPVERIICVIGDYYYTMPEPSYLRILDGAQTGTIGRWGYAVPVYGDFDSEGYLIK